MFVASFGAVLGNSIGFILGKYYGEDFFKEYWLWVWLGTTEVKYLKEKIHTRWPLWVILWKFHNLARSFVPFIAGSMEMNNRSFHIYNFISSIVRAVSMILLWILFAQYYEKIIDYLFTIMFVGMLLFLWYKYLFQKEDLIKYWKDKNEEIDEKIRRDEERALLKKHQKDAKRKASTGTLS